MTTRQRKAPKKAAMKRPSNEKADSKTKETNAQLKAKWTNMTRLAPLLSTICMGIIFGFTLNKGRVFEPQVIMDQFRFTRWIMMKMFLSAAATSILVITPLKVLAPRQYSIARASKAKYNAMAPVVGGVILGIGMAISGSCPGMVLIQIGAGVSNSVVTFIGGFSGALVYGLIEPFIRSFFSAKTLGYAFVDDIIPNKPLLAFVFAGLMFGIVFILETVFPWQSELSSPMQSDCHWLQCKEWSPVMAGIIVGLIQLPCVIMLASPIGCSSSYVCASGQWIRLLPSSKRDFFKHIKSKLNTCWQVVFVFAAIFGSMIAVQASGTMNVFNLSKQSFDGIEGNSIEKTFCGGFLMIFGARLANGCTSGHGLSGMGLLSIASMIAVAAMFVGGGIAAFII
eukprot:265704_1